MPSPVRGLAVTALLAAATATLAGCATTVDGRAQADPAALRTTTSAPTSTTRPSTPTTAPSLPTPTTSEPAGPGLPIVDAELQDDCLLTGEQMGALAGIPPMTAEQTAVTQEDGSVSAACFYLQAGSFVPEGRIQVYRADGVPVAAVMDQVQGDPVPGVGDRAILVRSGRQNVLWTAVGERILTTRLSGDLDGSNEAFAAAGQQAVAALAGR